MRIDYATDISPDHLYKVKREDEEDPNPQEIEKVEGDDLKEPPFSVFQSIRRWVHMQPGILKEGRVKRKEIEDDDADKKAALEKEAVKEDPYEFRLKPLSDDKCKLNYEEQMLIYTLAGASEFMGISARGSILISPS